VLEYSIVTPGLGEGEEIGIGIVGTVDQVPRIGSRRGEGGRRGP